MERNIRRVCRETSFKTTNAAIYVLVIPIVLDISTASPSDDLGISEGGHLDFNTNKCGPKMTERINELENKFDQAISELKLENEDQNEDIAVLKAGKKNQNQRIIALESEISQLKAHNLNQTIQIGKLIEKIVQDNHKTLSDNGILNVNKQPKTALRSSSGETDIPATSSEANLPTSCKDISINGHRLNGIYLLFNFDFQKILPTFCDFMHDEIRSKQLGVLNVKSSVGVYFYVQRNKMKDDDKPKVIQFNSERLNVGNAMNTTTGVFTVPTPGIYHFSFSISKDGFLFGELFVCLRVNGVEIGLAVSNNGWYSGVSTFQSILKLKKGDRIDLYKIQGKINPDRANINHFIGLLLEENLSLTNGN